MKMSCYILYVWRMMGYRGTLLGEEGKEQKKKRLPVNQVLNSGPNGGS